MYLIEDFMFVSVFKLIDDGNGSPADNSWTLIDTLVLLLLVSYLSNAVISR